MSKTRAFVLSKMTESESIEGRVLVLIISDTCGKALKISREYEWFSKWMHSIGVDVFCDGPSIDEEELIIKCD